MSQMDSPEYKNSLRQDGKGHDTNWCTRFENKYADSASCCCHLETWVSRISEHVLRVLFELIFSRTNATYMFTS